MNQTIQRLVKINAPMNFNKGATETSINRYESAIDVRFPLDFREWLLYSDGGEIFVPGTRFYGIEGCPEGSLDENNNKEKRSMFSLDDSLLIIGRFNFGDLLCLDVENYEVVQWDHENDEEFLRWDSFFSFLDEEIKSFVGEGD